MNITIHSGNWEELQVDALAIPLTAGTSPDSALDARLGGLLSELIENGEWNGKAGDCTLIHRVPDTAVKRLFLLGLGEAPMPRHWFAAAGQAVRQAAKAQCRSVALLLPDEAPARLVAEGVGYGSHRPSGYQEQKEWPVMEVILVAAGEQSTVDHAAITADGINLARELVEMPANDLGPEEFAMRAAQEGAQAGLEVEVLDENALDEMGAGAILAVGQGSVRPPRLVRLSWVPENSDNTDHLFLVGKGITFDTGGLSLKPANSMEKMKYDMGGAATMLGAIAAIGRLKPSVRISCLLVMAENMPSGKASRPGDIVTTMSGQTVEILNTDAEGRLVLADALCYARKQGITRLVDVATLTGAMVTTLGKACTGMMGNDDTLVQQTIDAGKKTGEKFWELPMFDEYKDLIKSDVADMKNSGGRQAGSISAALLLAEFVDGAAWVHLDIAGTSTSDKVSGYLVKGASGVPVRTLAQLASDLADAGAAKKSKSKAKAK